ncbi:MAG: nuclear transport factor 2 family protein [Chitinophagales bacterium]
MKNPLILFFVFAAISVFSQIPPEKIVQQQLDAYNRQDLKAFVATYHDSIEVYSFNNQSLMYKGKEQLTKEYAELFKTAPENYAALRGRIVQGNFVIDKEHVTGREYDFEATAIYEVQGGLIRRVWFMW